MPSSIPYDPTLVLGGVVDADRMRALENIGALQSKIDATEDALNAYIALRRSLQMTRDEIVALGVDPTEIDDQIAAVQVQLGKAAADYAQANVTTLPAIAAARSKVPQVVGTLESPIDYEASKLMTLAIGSDSLKLNVQYFRLDGDGDDVEAALRGVGRFVSEGSAVLGAENAKAAGNEAVQQINEQMRNHEIAGTLVISACCTHRLASLFTPLLLDADKAVAAWNATSGGLKLDPTNPESMASIATESEDADATRLNVISGASFGSSFVGMAHILKKASVPDQGMMADSLAKSIKGQLQLGAFVEQAEGGFGVSKAVSNSVQSLLSALNVTAHVTLATIGVIPTLKSNQVQSGVQQLANLDGKAMGDQLALLGSRREGGPSTVGSTAEESLRGKQMMALKDAQYAGMLSSLARMDAERDQVIDLASLMSALDDYLKKAQGTIDKVAYGVPVNYFLKPMSSSQIARLWLDKYFPERSDSPPTNVKT